MRRRTWALVRMSDIIFSHQVSLPSMIYEHDCDTQLPNNIFDDEFHPGSKELPPSRPLTEPTPISYMIAKARLCNEAGNILQLTNGIGKHVPYDEIVRYDAKLRQIMQELPPHLKLTPLEGTRDPVTLVIARFNVDILFQKILCLLHRKYLPRARQNSRYAHSRRSAMDASLRSLDHLTVLNKESKNNGRLRAVSWYVKSIATKDFILPAMLVILDLHFDNIARQSPRKNESDGNFLWTDEQRTQMFTALNTVNAIWKSLADTSMEAYKATKIIEIMLKKLQDPETQKATSEESTPALSQLASSMGVDPSPLNTQGLFTPDDSMPDFNPTMGFASPESSAFMGMDLGLPPSMMHNNFGSGDFGMTGAASPFSMFGTGLDNSGMNPELANNIDWVSLSKVGVRYGTSC